MLLVGFFFNTPILIPFDKFHSQELSQKSCSLLNTVAYYCDTYKIRSINIINTNLIYLTMTGVLIRILKENTSQQQEFIVTRLLQADLIFYAGIF